MFPSVSSREADRQRKAGKEDCIQMALIYLLPDITYSSQFPISNMEAIILQSFKGDFFKLISICFGALWTKKEVYNRNNDNKIDLRINSKQEIWISNWLYFLNRRSRFLDCWGEICQKRRWDTVPLQSVVQSGNWGNGEECAKERKQHWQKDPFTILRNSES